MYALIQTPPTIYTLVLSVVVSESGRRVLAVRDLNAGGVVSAVVSWARRSGSTGLGRWCSRLRRSRSLRRRHRGAVGGRSRRSGRTRRRLLAAPGLDDGGQDSPARAGRLNVNVGSLVRGSLEALVKGTGVAGVEKDRRVAAGGRIPRTDVVASVLADKVEDVGADVEASESVQVPVGFDSADLGVVIVVVGVSGADKLLGNSITKDQAEDAVALGVGLALIEGDENKGAAPEVGLLIVDKRFEEVAAPLAGGGDRSVVSVAGLYHDR